MAIRSFMVLVTIHRSRWFDFLLLHGANPNTRVCHSGDTPLITRCSTNRLEIIQLLLDNGADRYGTNPRARTSLFVADVIATGVPGAR